MPINRRTLGSSEHGSTQLMKYQTLYHISIVLDINDKYYNFDILKRNLLIIAKLMNNINDRML